MTVRNLDALLAPRSVALVGASPQAGSVGAIVVRNLLRAGFQGQIGFVNPRHREIDGRPCVPSLAALPFTPDLVIIATPPASIPAIVAEAGAKGARAAVVMTAGLTQAQKTAVLQAAQPFCLRVQGPNCLGIMLPSLGLDASFSHRAALPGDLAFLSQSGALITSIVDWAAARDIGFSHVVSLGDMSDVDFGDLLDYLAADTQSRAILMYVESITHAPKFLSAARRAARAKPVIVIKSGRHEAGARAARSHTGALAGSDAAYDAAFRRAGVLRVREIEQLFDAAETLSRVGRLTGDQLTILTNGGGAGVLAADRLIDWNGNLTQLSPDTIANLDAVLPAAWSRANPVDIIGDATPDRYAAAMHILLEAPEGDVILIINCPTALADSTRAAERLVDVIATSRANSEPGSRFRRPVLTVWLGDGAAEPGRAAFRAAGHPSFDSPDDAINGFMQIVRYRRAQNELMRTPPALPDDLGIDQERARQILADALLTGLPILSEVASKALLAAYGIATVPTRIAPTLGDVRPLAEELLREHRALVVKILSPDITHKSDAGGVVLDLDSAAACTEAATTMHDRIARSHPGARIDGFTLQPMIRRRQAHELIAGVTVDETFGPLIVFGAGGTGVEVLRDTAEALPPLDLGLAHDLMTQTRVFRLLSGYRDRPPADLDGIAMTLVRLSALVTAHPEIRELDINPLLADADGVLALDARVAIADPAAHPRAPMAIRPYPSGWAADAALPDGRTVRLRPIRPDDEHRYANFFARVTAADMRMRFFTAARSLSHMAIARLTQIDYRREMAFVAVEAQTGALLGVVRMMADPDYQRAEFAVLVASDLKGQGLGRALMLHLIKYASAEGLLELYGEVLAENSTMLAFCQRLGFEVREDRDDAELRHVVLPLGAGAQDGPPPSAAARHATAQGDASS